MDDAAFRDHEAEAERTGAAGRKLAGDADRRARIVAAAERAFVRHGFHATTMQHVAEEAGMSAGNLYRYFPSKEAIVEGLCVVDQGERAQVFSALAGRADLIRAMCETLRTHLLAKPPEKARMIIEIWSEASRNPRVAAITRAVDADVKAGLASLMRAVMASGATAPAFDPEFAAGVMFTVVAGLFKRVAIETDFKADAEAAMAVGVLKALCAGALTPADDLACPET